MCNATMGAKPSSTQAALPPGIPKLESSTDVLPPSYRHLGGFPVLAKQARVLYKQPPNLHVTAFLREHMDQAAYIADFLSVKDRTTFLVTHKVQLPPKLLKVLLFGGPSRETSFLICTSTSNLTGPSAAFVKHQGYQCEVRYRGSFLCRAVPLPMLAHTLHRVLRGWLSNRLRKYSFPDILAMIQKLIAAFRPTEQVWHAVVNNHGQDGATLLTYAVASNAHPSLISKLLEIPCFDLGMPDQKFRLNPIQLAQHLQRIDILRLFASVAGPEVVWRRQPQCYV